MKSILHDKEDRNCMLCMMLHGDISQKAVLQEHHVFYGSSFRKLSERNGLKVYLCLEHHVAGKEAVHSNKANDKQLKQYAQLVFEEHYGHERFMEIFGRNFL